MIYPGAVPGYGTIPVTYFAVGGIPGLDMVRVDGIIIFNQVAGDTFRGNAPVLIVLMTITTSGRGMHPIKREG
jgi:hypothetical protein